MQDGEVVETVEGADAASLTQAVQRHFGSQPSAQNGRPASAAAPPLKQPAAAAAGPQSEEALKALVNQQPVMLFMKVRTAWCIFTCSTLLPGLCNRIGNPMPRCTSA
jgi:hypothetical protein